MKSVHHAPNVPILIVIIMKTKLKYAIAVIASSFLLTGCCTTNRSSTQWEYKVAYPEYKEGIPRFQIEEPFLNNLAKDGWIFVQKDKVDVFFFKRAKK